MATEDKADEAARSTPRDVLGLTLKERPDLLEVAGSHFDYAQYLLDDDARGAQPAVRERRRVVGAP